MIKRHLDIVIFIVICVATLLISRHFFPKVIVSTTTVTDTIWKDTVITKYIPKEYPVYIDTSRIDTIYIPVDSTELVEKYIALHQNFYSAYFYKDTLRNDSSTFIQVDAKITQNKPVNYTLTYFDRTPSVINNTTNIYSQNEFYLGLSMGVNQISPSFLYKSKNNLIFGVGYNIQTNGIEGKAYINIDKIKLW